MKKKPYDLFLSLDENERKCDFRPRFNLMEGDFTKVELKSGTINHAPRRQKTVLKDGWEIVKDGNADRIYEENWEGAIKHYMPASIHTVYTEAGQLPDPNYDRDDRHSREAAKHSYWHRVDFKMPERTGRERLSFGGVCEHCQVFLNGEYLGTHRGMFGGPEYEVGDLLRDENRLIVKLCPAPYQKSNPDPLAHSFNDEMNVGWRNTTVFNCCYGWHYANYPALGIWRDVTVEDVPSVEIDHPFITTLDAGNAKMRLVTALKGGCRGFSGKLAVTVEPFNFKGEAYSFAIPVSSETGSCHIKTEFNIPNAKLWWPNTMGEQNLYRLRVSYFGDDGACDYSESNFGVRTVTMAPTPSGARSDTYDWTFVINGEPTFIRGANWCTLDVFMRFPREKYERFIGLAKNQGVMMLRAWGSGMVETDEFYDVCDENGIMVMQEWAAAWDSQKDQDPGIVIDMLNHSVPRLRNHPSLALWAGCNESFNPTDAMADMKGRLTLELDGTRAYHRTEPWGGSIHNYDVYWGMQPIDRNLSLTAPFIGEFGLACSPCYESVKKYVPAEDMVIWPPRPDSALKYHTPIYNTADDWNRLSHYSGMFTEQKDLRSFITGSQLSQATGLRHTLENNRSRWPESTGICYYKLTDDYPACSWSCVDYYGVPKASYYFLQDAYAPFHACVIPQKLNFAGEGASMKVVLLNDRQRKGAADVRIRAFNASLELIKESRYEINSSDKAVNAGTFELDREQTNTVPLLIVAESSLDGNMVERTFYWFNYEAKKGCLFTLPEAKLSSTVNGLDVTVENISDKPAVGVYFNAENISDEFTVSDNYFWLDPGEKLTVKVNRTDYIGIEAWNCRN